MSNLSLKEQLLAMTATSSQRGLDNQSKPQPTVHRKSNKKIKPKWLDYVHYGVELLRAYFPTCFKSAAEVRPLKKGIKQDLVKFLSTSDTIVNEDKVCMVKSLAYYVNTKAYHKVVVAGTARIDLNGQPAGVVSAQEAAYSVERQQAKLNAKQTATPSQQTKAREEIT
jgi:ProP effector